MEEAAQILEIETFIPLMLQVFSKMFLCFSTFNYGFLSKELACNIENEMTKYIRKSFIKVELNFPL